MAIVSSQRQLLADHRLVGPLEPHEGCREDDEHAPRVEDGDVREQALQAAAEPIRRGLRMQPCDAS